MKVWIDLSNSPHALLFRPISGRLEELGHEVLVTARDNAQTVELAQERWPNAEVIGGESPRSRVGKVRLIWGRVAALRAWARDTRPDVALSHNSYGQIIAARTACIPAVTAMDFEHQPANHLAFRLADIVLLPEVLRELHLRRKGLTAAKARYYPGLKEEIYLGDFEPDTGVVADLGSSRARGDVLVVARTPPTRAAYHRLANPLFDDVLRVVSAEPQAKVVVLARHGEQRAALARLDLGLIVPAGAIDARSLLYAADLVVGAGGTMTREAALLGLPTLTVFAGRQPAVDRWLIGRGLLRQAERAADALPIRLRPAEPRNLEAVRAKASALVELLVTAVGDAIRIRGPK